MPESVDSLFTNVPQARDVAVPVEFAASRDAAFLHNARDSLLSLLTVTRRSFIVASDSFG